MGAGVALDDERKERIKALLSAGKSKNQVAKDVKVSWATVDKVSKEAPDEIENLREHKRALFIDRLWNSMDNALGLADKRIKLALEGSEKLDVICDKIIDSDMEVKQKQEMLNAINNLSSIPLGQISTFIGTVYDKQALMQGQSTANVVSHNMNTDANSLTAEERRERIAELNRKRGIGVDTTS